MILELKNNDNTPLCFIGIQGSPTCSIYWGKHKMNKYKTESMMEDTHATSCETVYGVMTEVLDEMLREHQIELPYLEAPVKECLRSERSIRFFKQLYDLLDIPEAYRHIDELLDLNKNEDDTSSCESESETD